MGISNQPIFELEMLVVRQAIAKVSQFKIDDIFAWDHIETFEIGPDDFYELIKKIDLTPFQGSDPDPIPEVTLEDVEFIFHDKYWPGETVGALAAKLGSLVAYKKTMKDKNNVREYVENKKVLENYKKSLENQKKDPV